MNLIEKAKMKKLSKITKQKLSELDSDAFANLFEESERGIINRPSESFGMPVKQLLQPLGKVKKGHSI